MQISKQEKVILDKILNSKSFVSSPTSKALLKFLVQATFDEVDIKESVIGMHILGDRYDGETSNARIRVSVFHLRKKLESYYENEGANDNLKLSIEKGQYQVSFQTDQVKSSHSSLKFNVHFWYLLAILILVLILVASLYNPKAPIWKSLLSNNKETVMYIGDVYGFRGTTLTGSWGWQRDYTINSDEDFLRKKKALNLSDNDIEPANYSYVTASEADAVKRISTLFSKHNIDFSVRLASKIDVKDIKEQNVIYAGPIKTNTRFVQLLAEKVPQFLYRNDMLYIRDIQNGNDISLQEKYKKELNATSPSEIAVVSKLSGIHNTQQFLFFSDHDMGVRATVDYFTNLDSLKKFQKTYLKNHEDFTAVFLVNGKDRVDLGMRLLKVY